MNEDQKRVQTEVEMAMAEVARLKTVALELEKDTELKKVALNAEIALLTNKIPALENDVEIQKETLARMKKQVEEGQELVDMTKATIVSVKETLSATEKSLADRGFDLHTIETSIKNETNRFDSLLATKTAELKSLTKMIEDAQNLRDSNIAKHNIELLKVKKEMIDTQSNLSTAKEELSITTRDTNRLENQTLILRNERSILTDDVESLANEIKGLKEEKAIILASVEPMRAEMAKEQVALKALIKERIQQHEANRAVIAELDQREATLRERYEEVGLEYK